MIVDARLHHVSREAAVRPCHDELDRLFAVSIHRCLDAIADTDTWIPTNPLVEHSEDLIGNDRITAKLHGEIFKCCTRDQPLRMNGVYGGQGLTSPWDMVPVTSCRTVRPAVPQDQFLGKTIIDVDIALEFQRLADQLSGLRGAFAYPSFVNCAAMDA